MIKPAIVFVSLLAATTAYADDDAAKKAAQEKVDEAKRKGCEALKVALGKNKQCPEQAAAAAKVTCSAAAFAEVTALNTACVEVMKAKATAIKDKATSSAPATPTDKGPKACKATDAGGASVADLTTPTFVACMKEVRAAGKARCTAGAAPLKLTYQYADKKPLPMTITCPRAK